MVNTIGLEALKGRNITAMAARPSLFALNIIKIAELRLNVKECDATKAQ
jgi:hypothetical protein